MSAVSLSSTPCGLRCDALVLGGGPAGSAFAMRAARSGLRVILVEQHGFAEARPGEHLSGSTRVRLAALGLPEEPGLCRFSPGILSFWHSVTPRFRNYGASGAPPGFNTDRARLNEALFTHAAQSGVTTVMGRLAGAERREGGWLAEIQTLEGEGCRIRADLILDATGRSAYFLRCRGIGRRKVGDLFALVTWLSLSPDTGSIGAPLMIGSGAYGWWSLVEAGEGVVSLVVYSSQSALRNLGGALRDAAALMLSRTPYLEERLTRAGAQVLGQAIYPCFPCRASEVWGKGWLSLGDAAVALDPVSGQGVAGALEMAERACELVRVDPGLNQLGPLYAEALQHRFEDHLERRRAVYEEASERFGSDMLEGLIGTTPVRRRHRAGMTSSERHYP